MCITSILVRTGLAPERLAQDIRAEIQGLDPDVVLKNFATLKESFAFDPDQMDRAHSEMGKYAAVAPIFAVMTLLLAAVGLYAVIAHGVSQRTKKNRGADVVGAAASHVRRMVLRGGMLPVAGGLVVGLASTFGVNRVLQWQLVGVSPYDPVTLAGAPLVLVLVALLACLVPAQRAMKVIPRSR